MLARATDSIIRTAFYILLFAVPFLFTPWNYELFEFNKMIATYSLATVIVSAWVIKCVLTGQIIFRRTFLDIPLLLFLVSQVLSTYFSIDRHTSIWGYYSRSHGGLLSTITYLLLYWAFVSSMSVEQVKTALKYLLTSVLIISVWGILEHFGLSPSCLIVSSELSADCWVQDVKTRVFATLGQPNWMAAWLTAIVSITWAIAISKSRFWVWVGISAILFSALLFTKSRSGLLGFGAASIVFWGILALLQKKQISAWFRPFVIYHLSFVILIALFGTRWTPSLTELFHKTAPAQVTETTSPSETQLESGGTESGEIRKIVWKGAIDIWRAYPLFGSGVETFAYSYYNFRPIEHNNTSEWDFLYNKAHNEYLNFLSTTGVLGLGAYLLIIITFLLWSVYKLKTQMSESHTTYYILHISLLAGFASILVTNFFGFSVVNVATLFFLFPACAFVLTSNSQSIIYDSKPTIPKALFMLFVLCFMVYVLLRLAQIWQADSLYAQGTTLTKNGQAGASSQLLSQALEIRPREPNYLDAMANSLSTLALDFSETNDASAATKLAVAAQEFSNQAIAISPRNLSLLKSRSTTFYKLSFVDETYSLYSIKALERAIILAPTDPKIHYNLGVLYANIGEVEKAKELFKKTLQLKADFEDAKTGLQKLQEQP